MILCNNRRCFGVCIGMSVESKFYFFILLVIMVFQVALIFIQNVTRFFFKKKKTNKLGWFRTISISEGFAHDNITSDSKHLPTHSFSNC